MEREYSKGLLKGILGNPFRIINALIILKYFPNTPNDKSFGGPLCGPFSDPFYQLIHSSRCLRGEIRFGVLKYAGGYNYVD